MDYVCSHAGPDLPLMEVNIVPPFGASSGIKSHVLLVESKFEYLIYKIYLF